MTAPQHNAKPTADQPEAALSKSKATEAIDEVSSEVVDEAMQPSSRAYPSTRRIQRSWLIALGLLGSSGFVANQMSFALAESDLLIDDYAAAPEADVATPTVADTTFTYTESNFTPAPAVAPVEYAPTPAPPPVTYAESSAPAEPDWVAQYQTPLAAPATETPAELPAAIPTRTPASAPSIQIEIEQAPSSVTNPTVSEVAPPTFSSVRKPKKVARKVSPLIGLVEAGAATVPLPNYAAGSIAMAPSMVQLSARAQMDNVQSANHQQAANQNEGTTTLVALEGGSIEMEISPAAAAVPDILPESIAAPEAAPPIVDIAPAEVVPIQPTELVPAALPEGTNLPDEYNSVFVDPTDYSIGATEAPGAFAEGTPEIVISEQSTGCEFTVGAGQAVPNGACASDLPAAPAPVAAGQPAPVVPTEQYAEGQYYEEAAPVASAPAVNVGPVSFSAEGIRFSGATTAAGREYLNRTVRPLVNLQASEQFIFPLAIPSPITSLFGFRIHPITGDQRFHAGTDIGAAQGTPVLAAQDGTVSAAGYAGGYGLMVVLNHQTEQAQLESRYAHLSEILVESAATVKKGDVIGLVGSTGNSTGPHLHFEMRQKTADGWALVNPDSLLQYSLANLVKALNSPMQALNFNMADFNLRRTSGAKIAQPGLSGVQSGTVSGTDADATLPGLNGIPFRPAQPNAS